MADLQDQEKIKGEAYPFTFSYFSLLNALQDIFCLSSFLCSIFFPPKSVVFTFTECIYISIVVIAEPGGGGALPYETDGDARRLA